MALKSITQTNTAKSNFINNTGTAPIKRPIQKIKALSDPSGRYVKILLFGDYGTGKTFAIVDLLVAGLVVLVVTTDIGGDGLATVVAELNKRGLQHLKDNIVHVVLPTQEDVTAFFRNPNDYWEPGLRGAETIWDAGIDVLVWDGFTGYQQIQLADYVEENDQSIWTNDGKLDGQKYWGAIRRETARALNKFLAQHNNKTGQLWHKLMTCLDTSALTDQQAAAIAATEDDKEKRKKQAVKEAVGPFVQGSAAKLIGPAFDLVVLTNVKVKIVDGLPVSEYSYRTMKSEKAKVKARGVDLSMLTIDPAKATLRADMGVVWREAVKQLDIPAKTQTQEAA